MAWFTGTSSGNSYNVGQSYSMGGDTYTANANGSFTNERTGNSLVGSSQSSSVTWGGYESLTGSGNGGAQLWSNDPLWQGSGGSWGGSSGGSSGAGSHQVSASGGSATSGPGNAKAVAFRGGGVSKLGIGGPGFAGSLGHADYDPITPVRMGGYNMRLDESTSDGGVGEQRWGEWGGGLYGLGVMARDVAHMTFKPGAVEADIAKIPGAAVDFAKYLDERKEAVDHSKYFIPQNPRLGGDNTYRYWTGGGF